MQVTHLAAVFFLAMSTSKAAFVSIQSFFDFQNFLCKAFHFLHILPAMAGCVLSPSKHSTYWV